MLLALDVGNTTITLGRFDRGELVDRDRVGTDLGLDHIKLDGISEAVMASVVPDATARLETLLASHGISVLIADWRTIPIGVKLDRPDQVGADRLVNAFAGARLYSYPLIVVDLGTATTFDVVDASGAFVGGAIAPGIGLAAEALSTRTALLPDVRLSLPAHAIGTDTISAMQSGIVIGYIGLVRELVATISAEMAGNRGTPPRVVLTGGFSQAEWAQEIHADAIDPDLTLRGLAMVHAEVGAARPVAPA
jgi:type III pantothenate kinase